MVDPDAALIVRRQDRAAPNRTSRPAGWRQLQAARECLDEQLELEHRERCSEAAVRASAKREVPVTVRWIFDEPFGTERVRFGVQLGISVNALSIVKDRRSRTHHPLANREPFKRVPSGGGVGQGTCTQHLSGGGLQIQAHAIAVAVVS